MMPVYLDNAASMPPDPEAVRLFASLAKSFFANPESEHAMGIECSAKAEQAGREAAYELTGSREYNFIWTASATEAMALTLSCTQLIGRNVVCSMAEHPAFSAPLEQFGAELRKVRIRNDGSICPLHLDECISSKTSALAVHHVQNETGACQDLVSISRALRKNSPGALLIVDTVQSAGKLHIPFKQAGINIAFIGGHKIGFPSGGALIYKFDSERQKSILKTHVAMLRSKLHSIGRTDPPVALCLSHAIQNACLNLSTSLERTKTLGSTLRKAFDESSIDARFLIPQEFSSPYIASVVVHGFHAQVLVRMLSEKGVMVSAGSACEAASKKVSSTLVATGLSPKEARSVLRISFGFQSSMRDIFVLTRTLKKVLEGY
ncbi:MAG: aminotransferase class V-fold PLP-dependent enzyme [Victivallales bacterium]|nr:aminotransferase class V-fold PLP-dependent enzyme [Victivallales bacterium]